MPRTIICFSWADKDMARGDEVQIEISCWKWRQAFYWLEYSRVFYDLYGGAGKALCEHAWLVEEMRTVSGPSCFYESIIFVCVEYILQRFVVCHDVVSRSDEQPLCYGGQGIFTMVPSRWLDREDKSSWFWPSDAQKRLEGSVFCVARGGGSFRAWSLFKWYCSKNVLLRQ